MSDEEEDYMSDAFLAKLQDVTPSLIKNNSVKRQNEIEMKKKEQIRNRNKPIHEVQKEKLKEGLNKAITSDNKGFAMLSRMGFKPGTSLGKASSQSSAITEPIKININSDGRSGLGTQTAVRENRERQLNNLKRKMKASDMTPEEYRKQMREASDKKQEVWDLHKLQKTCRILDLEHSVKFPIHPWFWPKDWSKKNEESSEDDDDEESEKRPELADAVKLEMLRKFLRNSYFYCEFCGHQYTNAKEMLDKCPGPLKDDH